MFYERQISVCQVTAVALWVAGLTLVVVDQFVGGSFGILGIAVANLGAMMEIRSGFRRQAERERQAYQFGLETAEVRRLR